MKQGLLLASVAGLVLIGCAHAPEDAVTTLPAGAGKVTNLSGKPQTPEEARMTEQMKQGGQAAGNRMAQAAKEQEEAMRRTGGK